MNFYPWHIGDYAAATGHLEPMEDLAYRRLLDKYYEREAPLPPDIAECARLARLRAYADEVGLVLREFFKLTDEGWRHGRADEELQVMQLKQGAVEQRDEHEKTRQQRHNERRQELFAKLRAHDIHPRYDTKIGELEALVTTLDAPVTLPVTLPVTHATEGNDGTRDGTRDASDAPVTLPATAIPTPTPIPIPTPIPTPIPIKEDNTLSGVCRRLVADDEGEGFALNGFQPEPEGPPDCPHLEVLALWAEVMPDQVQHEPARWKGTRATHLRARWRETAEAKGWKTKAEGLTYLRKFFAWCRHSPFLMGKVPPRPGHRQFELELAWLVNPENWTKAHEGKYHPQG